MEQHRFVRVLGLALIGLALVACTPPSSRPTRLEVTTIQTICGGAVNPELPPCRSGPASRSIEVTEHGAVVATGTSDAAGHLVVDVPAAQLVVSVPGALPYMNCDTPAVTAVAGATTPVTQTCTLLVP